MSDPRAAELAVVIPCRGQIASLATCLASIRAQQIGVAFEVVVVDSAFDDRVATVVAGFPGVRLVRSREALLAGPARNLGVAHTRAPRILFTDADCQAEPGWLAAALRGFETGAAALGGPVLDAPPVNLVAAADNFLQFYDLKPGRPNERPSYLPSCNLALERASFERVGGFPACAAEDVLLTHRVARELPGGLRFLPDMRVRHRGRRHLREFLEHHRAFGRARGYHGHYFRPLDERFAHRGWWAGPLLLKRLGFMTYRTARQGPAALLRLLVLFPLVMAGAFAWAAGVVQGRRQWLANPGPAAARASIAQRVHPGAGT